MQKWEYFASTLNAHIDIPGTRDYLKKKYPNRKPARYSPETMEPRLNNLGEHGWELVHMEPVANVGHNKDIYFSGGVAVYSHYYFCVFKRPIE